MLHLPLLLAERRHSQQELAHIFNVKTRTIRRDIDALSRYYPIVDERDGRAVVYRFSDDYRYHPPPLTPIELATLLLAQESIAATGLTAIGSPFARYGRSLLAKVRSSLHPLVRDKLDALAAVLGSASVAAKDFAPHAVLIDRLTQAAVECRRVRLRYYTLATDTITERTVEPYAVYFDPDGATLKLIGYDHHRAKVIPFAIDHIRALRETEETFERPAGFDLQVISPPTASTASTANPSPCASGRPASPRASSLSVSFTNRNTSSSALRAQLNDWRPQPSRCASPADAD
jgi:predicted DNA-binding transcriptional regulator YafY